MFLHADRASTMIIESDGEDNRKPAHTDSRTSQPRVDLGLRLVALFKFTKALTLMGAGLGALRLLDSDFAARAESWSAALATGSGQRMLARLLASAIGLPPGRLELLGIGALLYAGLFAIEGLGLWLGRRWAEYLTLVATASFVPIELVEMARRPGFPPVGALALNLAVVAYLWHRIRRRQQGKPGGLRADAVAR